MHIALHHVAVKTGRAADPFTLYDDYTLLYNHCGVNKCGPLVSILSVHFQAFHVLRIQEGTPCFIGQAVVGIKCHLDDDLDIANAQHAEYS